jgi:hypothetical protein
MIHQTIPLSAQIVNLPPSYRDERFATMPMNVASGVMVLFTMRETLQPLLPRSSIKGRRPAQSLLYMAIDQNRIANASALPELFLHWFSAHCAFSWLRSAAAADFGVIICQYAAGHRAHFYEYLQPELCDHARYLYAAEFLHALA